MTENLHSHPIIERIEYDDRRIVCFNLDRKNYAITNGIREEKELVMADQATPELIAEGDVDTILSEYLTNHYDRKHAAKIATMFQKRYVEIDETAVHSIVMHLQYRLSESPDISMVQVLKDLYDKKVLSPEFNLLTGLVPPHVVNQFRNAFNFDELFNETKDIQIYALS